MENLLQDLRYGLRTLMKRPGFAAVAVITLALGIGANTAIFTVVDAALLRPLPYKEPERLVHLWETNQQQDFKEREASYPDYLDYKERNRVFEQVAGYNMGSVTLTAGDTPERIRSASVSANFFATLGVEAMMGRTFQEGEDRPGGVPLAILTHGLWQRRFGSNPNIVGETITLNGRPITVIGVLPPHFQFALTSSTEVWLSLNPGENQVTRRFMHWLEVIARLKSGVTLEQAQADMAAVASQIEQEDTRWHTGAGIRVVPLADQILGTVKPLLFVLLGAVAFVLLIACANVANLLLVRSAGRMKEVAIRLALGASRRRVMQQLMIESLALAFVGGAVGLLLAQWGVEVLVAAIPAGQVNTMPYLLSLGIDIRVFAFSCLLTLITGIVFGLAPALQATRPELQSALKEGGRTSAGSSRSRLRNLLVVSEIALALVLLVGAGLMANSLIRLLRVDPGFNTDNLLTFQVTIPSSKYREDSQRIAFHNQMVERLASLPGVKGVATVDLLPLSGGGNTGSPQVEGRTAPTRDDSLEANLRTISADYFKVMGIPLIKGRFFTERDDMNAPPVVLVNQSLANRLFPGQEPLGQRITFAFTSGQWFQIVGVVGDENVTSLDARINPVIYFPYLQEGSAFMSVAVRAGSDSGSLMAAVRNEIRSLDPEIPVYAERTMAQMISDAPSTFLRRYPALLIGAFAALALILASVGIYGVISYSVSQRTNEIGIRIALGARPLDIFRLVVGQGVVLILAGVGIGLVAAFALTRFLSGLLFGVAATDVLTYAGVSAVLAAVALAASFIPARRATKVDPVVALRYE